MSAINDDSDKSKGKTRTRRVVLASGIIAIGVLAALLFASQPSSLAPVKNSYTDLQSTSPIASASAQTYAVNGTQLIPIPSYFHGNYWGPPSTISTSGTATAKVKPDKFSVTVGVDTNGTTAEQATSKNADLMARVISAMKDLGVKDEQ